MRDAVARDRLYRASRLPLLIVWGGHDRSSRVAHGIEA